jgi:predicted amidohydrolase
MRVCLLPLKTQTCNPSVNLAQLEQRLTEIAYFQPDLVCLPECTLTGYLSDEADFRQFGESIPGPTTDQMWRLVYRGGGKEAGSALENNINAHGPQLLSEIA